MRILIKEEAKAFIFNDLLELVSYITTLLKGILFYLVLSSSGVAESGTEPRKLGLLLGLGAKEAEEGVVLHTDLPHPLGCSEHRNFYFSHTLSNFNPYSLLITGTGTGSDSF